MEDDWPVEFSLSLAPQRRGPTETQGSRQAPGDAHGQEVATCYGRPQDRSRAQHVALATHMRACKALHVAEAKQREQPQTQQHQGHTDDAARRALAVAAGVSRTVSALSREFRIDRAEVRRNIQCVAHVWLRLQRDLCSKILQETAQSGMLGMFVDTVVFDETKQGVVLHSTGGLPSACARSAWNVMVQERHVAWRDGHGHWQTLRFAVPPCILVGRITAETFADAIYGQAVPGMIDRFVESMRSHAAVSISIVAADADSKNRKLMGWKGLEFQRAGVLYSYFECGLHQVNLTVGSCCKVVGKHLVDGMFCYGKLLRTGNFWARSVLSAGVVIAERLLVVYTPVPPEALASLSCPSKCCNRRLSTARADHCSLG